MYLTVKQKASKSTPLPPTEKHHTLASLAIPLYFFRLQLCRVVEEGNLERVNELLAAGADIEEGDPTWVRSFGLLLDSSGGDACGVHKLVGYTHSS